MIGVWCAVLVAAVVVVIGAALRIRRLWRELNRPLG